MFSLQFQTVMDFIPETLQWTKCDDTSNVQVIPNTGLVFIINSFANGTDYNQRIGRVINMKAIRIRFSVAPTPASDMADQRIRILLVLDHHSNSLASTTITDVLQSASTLAPENNSGRLRFVILKDWLFQLSRLDVVNGLMSDACFAAEDIYMKLDIPAVYGSTSGLVAPESGALYLMAITSVAALNPTLSFTTRMYFTDA